MTAQIFHLSALIATTPLDRFAIMIDPTPASTMCELDPWDPNNWAEMFAREDEQEYRIYADESLETYAVVDRVDYQWAVQWCWHVNKPHPTRSGEKRYLVRQTSNSRRWGPKLYLHVEILKRAKVRRRTPLHTIADHKDGKELNCRRANLRWTTPKGNVKNTRRP